MKCEMQKIYEAHDMGPDFKLNLKLLMEDFQDVVGEHSKASGRGLSWLLEQKRAWVMHRICIQNHRIPQMGDELTFVTWHKGEKGFRAYRDYEVWCNTRKIVSASSLWLFIDLEKKKILKVPKESRKWYTVETANAMDVDIDAFKPVQKFEADICETISIRHSDFDPIGHVNNAIYLDFLETAASSQFSAQKKIRQVMIQYHKEITKDVRSIRVEMLEDKNIIKFNVMSDSGIHAFGDFTLLESA